jgi:hypothetical protein
MPESGFTRGIREAGIGRPFDEGFLRRGPLCLGRRRGAIGSRRSPEATHPLFLFLFHFLLVLLVCES